MVSLEILEKLFDAISSEPITFNKLCRKTKLHPNTVRKYLKIIEAIQNQKKLMISRREFRVIISTS